MDIIYMRAVNYFIKRFEYAAKGNGTIKLNQNDIDALNQIIEYRDWETDRKSTRLNSSHSAKSRMPSSA